MKSIQIEIPKEIATSLKMRPETAQKQLKEELAVHLYRQGFLSFGKARQLAEMTKWDFAEKLGELQIPRHYTRDDLEEDMKFTTRPPEQTPEHTNDRSALYQRALSVAGKYKSGRPDISINHDKYLEEAFG